MDYKAIAQETAQEVLGYSQDTSGWKVVKISVRKQVKYILRILLVNYRYRVEAIIPESTANLSDFLYQPGNRITWDRSLKVYKMIQRINSVICCLILDFCFLYLSELSLLKLCYVDTVFYRFKVKHSKLVMFVQTEMRGKLSPSIIEKTMPSNLVSFILNAKDGIKAQKTSSRRGFHPNTLS
uniref:StAR related lipid transfer domain containing 6 n=1 Tax=Propithecus coquereli TaxID=379532 RepID=A0A2K6EWW2_PROCO